MMCHCGEQKTRAGHQGTRGLSLAVKCGGVTALFMLNQAVLALGSEKVRLQPGDEADVKFGCAETPEPSKKCPPQSNAPHRRTAACNTVQVWISS